MLYITLYNYIMHYIIYLLDFGTEFGTRFQFWAKNSILVDFDSETRFRSRIRRKKHVFWPKTQPSSRVWRENDELINY